MEWNGGRPMSCVGWLYGSSVFKKHSYCTEIFSILWIHLAVSHWGFGVILRACPVNIFLFLEIERESKFWSVHNQLNFGFDLSKFRPVPTVADSDAEIGRNRTLRTPFLRLIRDDGWNDSDDFAAEFGLRCAPDCRHSSAKQTHKQNLKIYLQFTPLDYTRCSTWYLYLALPQCKQTIL
jgi:hypothetical protein